MLNPVDDALRGDAAGRLKVPQSVWVGALHESCAIQDAHERAGHSVETSHFCKRGSRGRLKSVKYNNIRAFEGNGDVR
jgi:hypothetical protein